MNKPRLNRIAGTALAAVLAAFAAAPSLGDVLTLTSSNLNNGPSSVTPPAPVDPAKSLAIASAAPHQWDPAMVALMTRGGLKIPLKR